MALDRDMLDSAIMQDTLGALLKYHEEVEMLSTERITSLLESTGVRG